MVHPYMVIQLSASALQRTIVLLLFANAQPPHVLDMTQGLLDCSRLKRSRHCSTTSDLFDSVSGLRRYLRLRNRVHFSPCSSIIVTAYCTIVFAWAPYYITRDVTGTVGRCTMGNLFIDLLAAQVAESLGSIFAHIIIVTRLSVALTVNG